MQFQSIENQKGEIEFRKKLALQQVEGARLIDDEFDAAGIEAILRERMRTTLQQMRVLEAQGIRLSPYIEIGAERGQRSLVMENDIGATGAAVDISRDMLETCSHYSDVFQKSRVPTRICCDANNLPFASDSIPFAFCYETLHHFPDPAPITKEIHRVLAPSGSFLFVDEPYKKLLHLKLYQGARLYSEKSLKRGNVRMLLDYFFSEPPCNEVDHGIVENEEISVREWKEALRIFDRSDLHLKSLRYIHAKSANPGLRLTYLLAYLLGGTLSGLCRKGEGQATASSSIAELLICPTCRETGTEVRLRRVASTVSCPSCRGRYPVANDILFLFTREKLEELYPEISAELERSSSA